MSEQERKLRIINLTFYYAVSDFDLDRDVEKLFSDTFFISDWNYAIPYLLIEDEKEF